MRETAGARLSRLLALVPWLERHDGVTIAEAANHFGVTAAELERDLWLTVCCGLPGHGPDQLIDIQFWDDDGTIHVVDAQTLGRPLRLRSEEAMALLVGLRMLAQVPGNHDRAALASATAKLELAAQVTPADAVVIESVDDARAALIHDAVESRRAVRIVYAGASRDEVTERVIEPGSLLHHGGRTYVAAWCRLAGAQRTFRLDRMRTVEVLDEASLEHVSDVSVPPASGVPVRLRVAPRSRWLLESMDAFDVLDSGEGVQEASIVVAEPQWLVRIVLGQAGGVEIMAPEALRLQACDAARRALADLG
jgi:predicted DNA-binding transcriptional regulator YafY